MPLHPRLPATRFPHLAEPSFDRLCAKLSELTAQLEQPGVWPREQLSLLGEAGVAGWVIPQEFGGAAIPSAELTVGYERLAASCLMTAFVLTQRNGACQRLAVSTNDSLKHEFLPPLCRGELFATVGISHLTTSRQHVRTPAVQLEQDGDAILLQGSIPWVTGAPHADFILTGGTFTDGRQALLFLPVSERGVTVEEPPTLLAMNASQTASVRLQDVRLSQRFLVAGPVKQVMQTGQIGGTGSLTTSALAIGAAAASIERMMAEAEKRPELEESCSALASDWSRLYRDLTEAAIHPDDAAARGVNSESIRRRANSLVLRAAQASLAASKGAGFVSGHPAERAVREAMFFLVWS
ncbi:MAG: acyl-CoA/acyl-ACP dehydrogenase, partial [Planctomycetaceae bacterium]|nr:acyl-CoA/acyl-ACP dehydrogenase [Planctomycetaceae bacterium]